MELGVLATGPRIGEALLIAADMRLVGGCGGGVAAGVGLGELVFGNVQGLVVGMGRRSVAVDRLVVLMGGDLVVVQSGLVGVDRRLLLLGVLMFGVRGIQIAGGGGLLHVHILVTLHAGLLIELVGDCRRPQRRGGAQAEGDQGGAEDGAHGWLRGVGTVRRSAVIDGRA